MEAKLYQKVKLKDGKVGYIIEDFGDGNYLLDCPLYKEGELPQGRKYNDYKQYDITKDDILLILE